MGNFYTNMTVRTSDREALIEHMRGIGRNCFVSLVYRGFTVVYDRLCDEQDVRDLELLTTELSAQFHCSALATLNHDDDVLWMGLASRGEWVTTYSSDQIFSGSAWRISREFNVVGLVPLVWFLMRWPIVLFAIWRHGALASVLGLPKATVGFGYKYLARGEKPEGDAEQFERV